MTQEIEISTIKIGDRYRKDLQDLATLMESITRIGLLHPVVLNENHELIAGARRLEACRRLGMNTIPCHIIHLENLLEGEYDENVVRVDFLPTEAVAIAKALRPVEEEKAEERMKEGKPCVKFTQGKTREKLGTTVGMSWRTLEKAEAVVDSGDKDLIQAMDGRAISIDKAHRTLKQKENRAKQKDRKMPKGKFDIIYADPPWKYDFSKSDTRKIEGKYSTMSMKAILELKEDIPWAEDSVLFLWVPMPKIREGLEVMNGWGYEYKTGMVWVKNKIGMGYYVRGQHELLLIGTKGQPGVPFEEDRPSSVIQAPRTKHSEKPKEVYSLIEKMYPDRKYLELFARDKRKNWNGWGNEL